MLIVNGVIFLFICIAIGILRLYKNKQKSEVYPLDCAEVIIFGWVVLMWCGWIDPESTMPLFVPILVTAIFLILFIGKKIFDADRVKHELIEKYLKEKKEKWGI